MIRHMLNRCYTQNRVLKRQLNNNRFLSFISWFGLAFLVGVEKQSVIPVLLFAVLVYSLLFYRGKL